MKTFLKTLASTILGNYQLYRIYESTKANDSIEIDVDCVFFEIEDVDCLNQSRFVELKALADFFGPEAFGYGISVGGELACVCWFAAGQRYRNLRNFWPLGPAEAKLVQITTSSVYRGRGLAPQLIALAASAMQRKGYSRLFARIWHSNLASLVAFKKAGWREVAFVVEISPFNIPLPIRFTKRVN